MDNVIGITSSDADTQTEVIMMSVATYTYRSTV